MSGPEESDDLMHTVLSIIIPTYNRASVLRRTLQALREQDLGRSGVETIVVDDGSDDETADLVAMAVRGHPHLLRYIYQENQGAASARNEGLKQARGTLVLFIDADIIAAPYLLSEHLRFHDRHPTDHAAVLGNVMLAPQIPSTAVNRMHAVHKWQRLCHGQELDWTHFRTGNISVKRAFLLDNQLLFDERLPYLEDTEIGYRAARRGLRIIYNSHAIGYHFHDMSLQEFTRLNWHYGSTLALLHRQYPQLRNELADYLALPRRQGRRRLLRGLMRDLLVNRITVPGLIAAVQGRSTRETAALVVLVHWLGNYFERQGYKHQNHQMLDAGSIAGMG